MSNNEMVERIAEDIKKRYGAVLYRGGISSLVGKAEAKRTRENVEHNGTVSILASLDTLKMLGLIDDDMAWAMMNDISSRIHNWIYSFE